MRLNHLHLRVADLDHSQTFYETWFGFRHHVRHGSTVFLRDDADLDLALAPVEALDTFPAWFHFGFRLESSAAVEALHQAMIAGGVTITQPLESWDDFSAFRCADPDGYRIEVYWE